MDNGTLFVLLFALVLGQYIFQYDSAWLERLHKWPRNCFNVTSQPNSDTILNMGVRLTSSQSPPSNRRSFRIGPRGFGERVFFGKRKEIATCNRTLNSK